MTSLRKCAPCLLSMFSAFYFCASTFSLSILCAQEYSQESDPRSEYLQFAIDHTGDAQRGEILFNNQKLTKCLDCHLIYGMEKSGPNLAGVSDKYNSLDLIRQILYPSEQIAPGFEQITILTKDGKVRTGRVERASRLNTKLIDAQGKEHNIRTNTIEEQQTMPTSLMPDDLQKTLSKEQFADLIAYLETLTLGVTKGLNQSGQHVEIPHINPQVNFVPIHQPDQKFETPIWVAPLPGTDSDLVVIEHMASTIYRVVRDGNSVEKKIFVDLNGQVHVAPNQGVMCVAFHPDFVNNRRYYVEHEVSEDAIVKTTVVERHATPDGLSDDGTPSIRLLEVFQPASNHSGGCIGFGKDGMLYIGFGDGGPQKDPNGYCQNPRISHGSMLRIDVDHKDPGLNYAIPKDNPYWDQHRQDPSIRAETWAIGLREPWRFSFDSLTGELYAGDVGQNKFEEVNLIEPGKNYGWNVREAFDTFSEQYHIQGTDFTNPLFAYEHGLGFSVTGGYVYRGQKHPSYQGVYIFGDYNTRKVWGLKQTAGQLECIYELGTAPQGIASFGLDQQGEIYLVTYLGTIYHIDLSGTVFPGSQQLDSSTLSRVNP